MNLEGIKIVHAIPGRMRLKVVEVRENPTLASELQRRLTSLPGVQKIEVNLRTGSVLILYAAAAFASVEALHEIAKPLAEIFPNLDINESRIWLSSVNGSGSAPSFTQGISSLFAGLKKNIDAATSGLLDLRALLPLGLVALGLRSFLLSKKRPSPTWYDFFWFALVVCFLMSPQSGEQPPP